MIDEQGYFNKVKTIYSCAHFGKSLLWYASEFIFGYYLAEIYQIPPITIGKLLFIFLLWDAITDPILVLFITRKPVTINRLIKFQLIGAILSAASFISIFFKPDTDLAGLSLYALIAGLLFRTAYTYYDVPQNTLVKRLGKNEPQRLSLFAYRNAFSAIAALTVSISTGLILSYDKNKELEIGFLIMAVTFVCVSTALSCSLFKLSTQQPSSNSNITQHTSLPGGTILKRLLSDTRLILLLCSMFLLSIGWPLTLKLVPFFNTYIYQRAEFTGIMLSAMAIANIASQPLWIHFGKRYKAKTAFIITVIFACMLSALFVFFATNYYVFTVIIITLLSASLSGLNAYIWLLLTELITKAHLFERYDTVIFGLFTFSSKIGLGVGGLLLGATLEFIGYKQGHDLTINGSDKLIFIMGISPLLCVLLATSLTIMGIRSKTITTAH